MTNAPLVARKLGAAVQLRNRIAHGYGTLDVHRLWTELPNGLRSFSAFASAVAAFLRAHD